MSGWEEGEEGNDGGTGVCVWGLTFVQCLDNSPATQGRQARSRAECSFHGLRSPCLSVAFLDSLWALMLDVEVSAHWLLGMGQLCGGQVWMSLHQGNL